MTIAKLATVKSRPTRAGPLLPRNRRRPTRVRRQRVYEETRCQLAAAEVVRTHTGTDHCRRPQPFHTARRPATQTSPSMILRQSAHRLRRCGGDRQPGGDTVDVSMHANAENERPVKWEAVLLLGASGTISAARTWHECAWKLELILPE
jgi:hypothetical protein